MQKWFRPVLLTFLVIQTYIRTCPFTLFDFKLASKRKKERKKGRKGERNTA
jgi:hypothetical protein